VATADLCRKHGRWSASFYAWNAKYGGAGVAYAQKPKTLQAENVKLKRPLADANLDNAAPKELRARMVTPAQRREAVAHLETPPDPKKFPRQRGPETGPGSIDGRMPVPVG